MKATLQIIIYLTIAQHIFQSTLCISMSQPRKMHRRTVYNQDYYKAQAMLRDDWFKGKIEWLRKRFTEVGCPVPIEGYATNEEYQAWREAYWERYSEMNRSEYFKAKTLEITGGQASYSGEVYDELESFQDGYLPPMYGGVFSEILRHFGIDHENQQFKYFLEFYIFRGRTELPSSNFSVRLSRDQKTNELELLIKIHGFTKKEDIMGNWDFIVEDQKYLPDYQGKSKKWVEFERDLEIYKLWKAIKQDKLKRQGSWQAVDMDIYAQLHHKYPEITITSIRSIVLKTAKRLDESITAKPPL